MRMVAPFFTALVAGAPLPSPFSTLSCIVYNSPSIAQYSHSKHHAKTNHLMDGESHNPDTKADLHNIMGISYFKLHEALGDDGFAMFQLVRLLAACMASLRPQCANLSRLRVPRPPSLILPTVPGGSPSRWLAFISHHQRDWWPARSWRADHDHPRSFPPLVQTFSGLMGFASCSFDCGGDYHNRGTILHRFHHGERISRRTAVHPAVLCVQRLARALHLAPAHPRGHAALR